MCFSIPHRFVLEQLCHLVTGLALVSIASPVVWHVVNVRQHALQQLFWTPHHMLIWDKGPGVGQVQSMYIFSTLRLYLYKLGKHDRFVRSSWSD